MTMLGNLHNRWVMHSWVIVGMAAYLISLAVGCRAKKGDDEGDAPAVPSHVVMILDASILADGGALTLAETSPAYDSVIDELVGPLLQLNLALKLPSDLLRVARDSVVPSYLRNTSWAWSYNFSNDDYNNSVGLTGTKNGDERTWLLELTKVPSDFFGCCNSFDYITGTSTGVESGRWQIFDPSHPKAPTLLHEVSWVFASETSYSATVTFPRSPNYAPAFQAGSWLSMVVSDTAVTATLSHDPASEETIVVRWDSETGAGSRTEGEVTECWDGTMATAECEISDG